MDASLNRVVRGATLQIDERAAAAALKAYSSRVRHCARQLEPMIRSIPALDIEDLRAEGNVAVLEALREYTAGSVGEQSFVHARIRYRMIDAIRRMCPYTRSEISEMQFVSHVTCDDAQQKRPLPRTLIPIHTPHTMTESSCIMHRSVRSPTQYDIVVQNSQRQRLQNALNLLPDRYRVALQLKVHDELSLEEIGMRMGISGSRVCQLQKRGLEIMQRILQDEEIAHAA